MSSPALRITVAVVSAGIALLVGRQLISDRNDDGPTEAEDRSSALVDVIAARTKEGGGARTPGLQREVIPEHVARRVFKNHLGFSEHEYDPQVYYRWVPHAEETYPHDEHPAGQWTITTNSTGMRGSREPAAAKPDLRILIAGDSQTEGYCNDDETYPALLEAALRAAHPDRTIEVLNPSCGGYHFYNHLGLCEKYAELEPDVFVHAVYGGNDFVELLALLHYFERIPLPQGIGNNPASRWKEDTDIPGGFRNQALAQADVFHRFPAEKELAIDAACEITAEIMRLCAESGVEYLCLYIPPLAEVQPERYPESHLATMDFLGVTPEQTAVSRELADRLFAFIRERGGRVLDMAESLRAADEDLYWHFDHHLNLAGDRHLATALARAVDDLFTPRPR